MKLLDRKPERLVVTGLRCCMAGYADALIAAGQKLLSVPAQVIHSIAAFGSRPVAAKETLH
ncbi:MAG TPA: hypothetical protein VL101_03405 [Nordella sp.]|nr:hypothetical protein [Nordella sp.]